MHSFFKNSSGPKIKTACRDYDRPSINILKDYIQIAGSLTSECEIYLTTNANMYKLLSF